MFLQRKTPVNGGKRANTPDTLATGYGGQRKIWRISSIWRSTHNTGRAKTPSKEVKNCDWKKPRFLWGGGGRHCSRILTQRGETPRLFSPETNFIRSAHMGSAGSYAKTELWAQKGVAFYAISTSLPYMVMYSLIDTVQVTQ